MNTAIRVMGQREVTDRLGAIGRALDSAGLLHAVTAGALIVENDAKVKVPKITGNLMRSLHTEGSTAGASVSVQVGTNVDYGPGVEFGTGPHDIVPIRKKALYWKGAAHPVKRVHHPGSRAKPYLRPAYDQKKDEALSEMARVGRALVERAARG